MNRFTPRPLQDDFPDVGAITIRAAVQLLVDEGGRGHPPWCRFLRVGSASDRVRRVSAALERLHLVRSAATRALQTLEGHVIRPVRVPVERPENPVTEVWGYTQSAY